MQAFKLTMEAFIKLTDFVITVDICADLINKSSIRFWKQVQFSYNQSNHINQTSNSGSKVLISLRKQL